MLRTPALRTSLAVAFLTLGLVGTSSPASAKGKEVVVYVNGTDATGMKDFEFKAVDVRIDSNGNIWIDAPRYRIQVNKPAGSETTSTAAAPAPTTSAVAAGSHWLVTQDAGSAGQVVEVVINGTSVREIRSGQAQLILDIGQWLQPGSNVVTFRPAGGDAAASGSLKIHLGLGSNESGTLKLDNPQLTWDTATNQGEKSAEYVVK